MHCHGCGKLPTGQMSDPPNPRLGALPGSDKSVYLLIGKQNTWQGQWAQSPDRKLVLMTQACNSGSGGRGRGSQV